MQGTGENMFGPYESVTRGMVVTVLQRLSNAQPAVRDSLFIDVTPDDWFYSAVNWAAENGIVSGYGEGLFGPMDGITREQMAVIFYNYSRFIGFGPQGEWAILLDFEDVADISDWAMEGAMYCYMSNFITGRPGNLFAPRGSASRAELAAVLMRFIQATG